MSHKTPTVLNQYEYAPYEYGTCPTQETSGIN